MWPPHWPPQTAAARNAPGREISGEFAIVQQDKKPAHRACETVSVLQRQTSMIHVLILSDVQQFGF